MRREEAGHVVIVESESAASQLLGIGGEIQFPAEDSCFQLCGAIAAVPIALQNLFQICQEENIYGCICRNLLLETEVSRLVAELSALQRFEEFLIPVVYVSPGGQSDYVVHDQIQIVEMAPGRIDEVGRDAAS